MLPTFVGIGVPRAGTTWLNGLLSTHPEIFLPEGRKEVHFFDRYFERGLDWYTDLFPEEGTHGYKAVGEITPHYLFYDECAVRIRELLPEAKLLVMLRNPVDRAYSHFGLRTRVDNYQGSFEEFLEVRPEAIEWGYYSQGIERYLKHFERSQLGIFIYEQMTASIGDAKHTIADFLNVDPSRFAESAGTRRVNQSYVPKAQRAYAFAVSIARRLRRWDMLWIINLGKKLGMRKAFGNRGGLPSMQQATRERLTDLYHAEVERLESLLALDLSCWENVSSSQSAD